MPDAEKDAEEKWHWLAPTERVEEVLTPWHPVHGYASVDYLNTLQQQLADAEERTKHLEDCLDQINIVVDGYSWLGEGRGPYHYDDQRYDDDVRAFVAALNELLPPSKSLGWAAMLQQLADVRQERDRFQLECQRLAIQALQDLDRIEAAEQERDRYRKALETIKRDYGRVCEQYEICGHESCRSSYSSWATADAALTQDTGESKG